MKIGARSPAPRSFILSLPANRKRPRLKNLRLPRATKFRRLKNNPLANNYLQGKALTQNQEKSASRIPTPLRRRTFRHISIQLRIIPGVPGTIVAMIVATTVVMTAKASIMAVEAIAGAADAGAGGADVIAAAASKVVPVDGIFRRPSMLRRRAGNFAVVTTIAIAGNNAMTTADRKVRALRARRLPTSPTKRFFFPANRSQSIATKP